MIRFLSFLFTIIPIILLSFSYCLSDIYYVDGSRPDNSGAGTSWTTAKKTIMAGCDLIRSAGDELRIKTGTYSGTDNYVHFDRSSDPDGTSGNEIIIRSDDGEGNYGNVVVRGSVSSWNGNVTLLLKRVNYYKIQSIQFDAPASGANAAAHLWGTSGVPYSTNVDIEGCIFNGSGSDYVLAVWGYSNTNIFGNTITADTSMGESTVDIFGNSQSEPDPTFDNRPWPSNLNFYNNTVSGGTPKYSAVTFKRVKNSNIYGNYISADGYGYGDSSAIVRVRHGTDIEWYNNVLKNSASNSAGFVYTIRGMTAEPQPGPCGAYDSHFYNNTIDANGVTMGFIRHWNDSSDNIIQNNLLIGNIDTAVNWDNAQYCDGCGETTSPSGNLFRYNVATGSVGDWDESGLSGWTLNGNQSSAGASYINLQGSSVSCYYNLVESYNGSSEGIAINKDFNNQIRDTTPDVGAFEWSSRPSPNNLRF